MGRTSSGSGRLFRGVTRIGGRLDRRRGWEATDAPTPDFRRGIFEGEGGSKDVVAGLMDDRRRGGMAQNKLGKGRVAG